MALVLLAGPLGAACGGRELRPTSRDPFPDRGAEGDREVSEGPGLFTGEAGGIEFDLLDVLRERAQEDSVRGVPTGPE